MADRSWVLHSSQERGFYSLVWFLPQVNHREPDHHGMSVEATVYGTLAQFEQLAQDVLRDVAAIRAGDGAAEAGEAGR